MDGCAVKTVAPTPGKRRRKLLPRAGGMLASLDNAADLSPAGRRTLAAPVPPAPSATVLPGHLTASTFDSVLATWKENPSDGEVLRRLRYLHRKQYKFVDEPESARPGSDADGSNGDSEDPFVFNTTTGRHHLREDGDFSVVRAVHDRMFQHQRTGVQWLHSLHRRGLGMGGILADDMGLGKTFQVVSLLSGLFGNGDVEAVLIVVPPSVLMPWQRELRKWIPGVRVHEFHSGSKKQRIQALDEVMAIGGVVITTYGMVVQNVKLFRHPPAAAAGTSPTNSKATKSAVPDRAPAPFVWDYLVLDEAHQHIKNHSTNKWKAIRSLVSANNTKHPLLVTGTPIENKLLELHALMKVACPGDEYWEITQKEFKEEFEEVMGKSLYKRDDSELTDVQLERQRLSVAKARELNDRVFPYMLQRKKEDIFGPVQGNDGVSAALATPATPAPALAPVTPGSALSLGRKDEIVLWTFLSPLQEQLYRSCLNSRMIKDVMENWVTSPLAAIVQLQKICRSPHLSGVMMHLTPETNAALATSMAPPASDAATMVPPGPIYIDSNCECPICMDVIQEPTSTECGHVFCKRCIDGHITHAQQSALEVHCPLCNVRINGALLRSVEDIRYGILASLRHGCTKGNDEVSIDAPALELLQQMMIGVLDTLVDNIVRVACGRPMVEQDASDSADSHCTDACVQASLANGEQEEHTSQIPVPAHTKTSPRLASVHILEKHVPQALQHMFSARGLYRRVLKDADHFTAGAFKSFSLDLATAGGDEDADGGTKKESDEQDDQLWPDFLYEARQRGTCIFPGHWHPQQHDTCQIFELEQRSEEFTSIAKSVESCDSSVRVYRVERVQNIAKYELFSVVHRHRDNRGDAPLALWHGTDSKTVAKIVRQGFNRSFSRVAAYGKGVYFASSPTYSLNPRFAKVDENGRGVLIRARLAAGIPAQGAAGMLEPPEGAHYAVDCVTRPQVYVSFNDNDTYCEYLVHFERCSSASSATCDTSCDADDRNDGDNASRFCAVPTRNTLHFAPSVAALRLRAKTINVDEIHAPPTVSTAAVAVVQRVAIEVLKRARANVRDFSNQRRIIRVGDVAAAARRDGFKPLRHCFKGSKALTQLLAASDECTDENSHDSALSELKGGGSRHDTDLKLKGVSAAKLVAESGKLAALLPLMQQLRRDGHRTLIFSPFKTSLDVIAKVLNAHDFKMLRIDGDVPSCKRQPLIDMFQLEDSDIDCFLLSTTVAGVGITLTRADRVIIFDPSWNPAKDDQAVDRCYRMGQRRDVVTYRMITSSTVEEVQYRAQVKKSGWMKLLEKQKVSDGYFTRHQQHNEMFVLDNARVSQGCLMLEERHHATTILQDRATLAGPVNALKASGVIFGASAHSVLYKDNVVDEADKNAFGRTPGAGTRSTASIFAHKGQSSLSGALSAANNEREMDDNDNGALPPVHTNINKGAALSPCTIFKTPCSDKSHSQCAFVDEEGVKSDALDEEANTPGLADVNDDTGSEYIRFSDHEMNDNNDDATITPDQAQSTFGYQCDSFLVSEAESHESSAPVECDGFNTFADGYFTQSSRSSVETDFANSVDGDSNPRHSIASSVTFEQPHNDNHVEADLEVAEVSDNSHEYNRQSETDDDDDGPLATKTPRKRVVIMSDDSDSESDREHDLSGCDIKICESISHEHCSDQVVTEERCTTYNRLIQRVATEADDVEKVSLLLDALQVHDGAPELHNAIVAFGARSGLLQASDAV